MMITAISLVSGTIPLPLDLPLGFGPVAAMIAVLLLAAAVMLHDAIAAKGLRHTASPARDRVGRLVTSNTRRMTASGGAALVSRAPRAY